VGIKLARVPNAIYTQAFIHWCPAASYSELVVNLDIKSLTEAKYLRTGNAA